MWTRSQLSSHTLTFKHFCEIVSPELPLIFQVSTIRQVIWQSPGTLAVAVSTSNATVPTLRCEAASPVICCSFWTSPPNLHASERRRLLQGFLITAPPSVCVRDVIGALACGFHTKKKKTQRAGWPSQGMTPGP